VADNLRTGAVGQWTRLGPWTATVSDGTLNLSLTGNGWILSSGLEIWYDDEFAFNGDPSPVLEPIASATEPASSDLTHTPTFTPTWTATLTETPTFTPSATWTTTSTMTPALTATATFTPSATWTAAATTTPTETSTLIWTATVTETPTSTVTHTATFTATASPTHTPTVTETPVPVASGLAFIQHPGSAAAGSPLPTVTVELRDSNNLPLLMDGVPVTLALGSNPLNGALSGTLTVTTIGGVATFSGLSIDIAAEGYTMVATSGALTPAYSSTFNVISEETASDV
jgi:hypothetical protein